MLIQGHNFLNNIEAMEMAECIYNTALRLNRLVQNCLYYTELELTAIHPDKIREPKSCTKDIINQVASRLRKPVCIYICG
jgi:K+-sensing histidine kinase KdpD